MCIIYLFLFKNFPLYSPVYFTCEQQAVVYNIFKQLLQNFSNILLECIIRNSFLTVQNDIYSTIL